MVLRRYLIESTGNGAFYTITRLEDGATLFLQGDDALAFERELFSANRRFTPEAICDQYAELFQV